MFGPPSVKQTNYQSSRQSSAKLITKPSTSPMTSKTKKTAVNSVEQGGQGIRAASPLTKITKLSENISGDGEDLDCILMNQFQNMAKTFSTEEKNHFVECLREIEGTLKKPGETKNAAKKPDEEQEILSRDVMIKELQESNSRLTEELKKSESDKMSYKVEVEKLKSDNEQLNEVNKKLQVQNDQLREMNLITTTKANTLQDTYDAQLSKLQELFKSTEESLIGNIKSDAVADSKLRTELSEAKYDNKTLISENERLKTFLCTRKRQISQLSELFDIMQETVRAFFTDETAERNEAALMLQNFTSASTILEDLVVYDEDLL